MVEYAAVEVRVVGRVEEIVKATASEHEGKEGARRRGRRVVMRERKDEDVFHCEFKEEEGEGHVEEEEEEETRRGGGTSVLREGARI